MPLRPPLDVRRGRLTRVLALPLVVAGALEVPPPGTRINHYLGFDFHEGCSEGAVVAARQPLCRNASAQPWFPGTVVGVNPVEGSVAVVYGWDAAAGRWADETKLTGSDVLAVPCLDQWPPGDPGRGYGYLPSCETSECIRGCRAVPAGTCQQGDVIAFGANCTVQCPEGMLTGVVNLTCGRSAELSERTAVCEVPIVYCDELDNFLPEGAAGNESLEAGGGAFNATQRALELGCALRAARTTTTTLQAAGGDLVLRGCAELAPLRAGVLSAGAEVPPLPVGVLGAAIAAGAFYFEVVLEGPWEQVGFLDGDWTGSSEDDAAHEFLSALGGPGVVGAAVRVIGKGLAEFWFHRDGKWQGTGTSATIGPATFTPPLRPAGLFRGRHSWVLPYDAWRYFPPRLLYRPLTSLPFPNSCRYPLDFVAFSAPPVCGPDFEALEAAGDCSQAAFYAGLADWSVTEVAIAGWPRGCLSCPVCDLSGDLYLNVASVAAASSGTSFEYSANGTAVVCRRRDAARTSTATTTTATAAARPTALPPLYRRFGDGACGPGYLAVSEADECRLAAASLALADAQLQLVTLPQDTIIRWPSGCFYCATCGAGSLFLNNASVSNASATAAAAGDEQPGEPLCRASPEILTTGPPTTTAPTAPPPTTTTTTFRPFATTTSVVTTTTTKADLMGLLQCEGAYMLVEEAEWWQRWEVYAGASALFVLCCCCPCCCVCSGLAGYLASSFELWVERRPRLRRTCCCRCLFAVAYRCARSLAAISPRSPRSPRRARSSTRGLEEGTAGAKLDRTPSAPSDGGGDRKTSPSKESESSGRGRRDSLSKEGAGGRRRRRSSLPGAEALAAAQAESSHSEAEAAGAGEAGEAGEARAAAEAGDAGTAASASSPSSGRSSSSRSSSSSSAEAPAARASSSSSSSS